MWVIIDILWGIARSIFGWAKSITVTFLAFKILITGVFLVILPYVLKSVILWVMHNSLSLLSSHYASVSPTVVQLSGLAAYLAQQLRLVDAIAILMSALLAKIQINMVKAALL